MKQHAGLEAHDGYAPHSHEVRSDHEGVPGIMDDARHLPPQGPAGDVPLTSREHCAEAARLLRVISSRSRRESECSSGELAVIALAHAVTSLAAGKFRNEPGEFPAEGGPAPWKPGEFPAEGGSAAVREEALPDGSLRNRILAAMRNGGNGLTAQDLALSLLVPSPVITGELGQLDRAGLVTAGYGTESGKWFLTPAGQGPGTPEPCATLREQITFWLGGVTSPDGWTLRALADQAGQPESKVLAELLRMKNENLARSTEREQEITWSLLL
jgi:hypothetical protein